MNNSDAIKEEFRKLHNVKLTEIIMSWKEDDGKLAAEVSIEVYRGD